MTNQAILNLIPNLESLPNNITIPLKGAISDMMKGLTQEIFDAMIETGENKDNYKLELYPFSLSRIDGKKVPNKLLKSIEKRMRRTMG